MIPGEEQAGQSSAMMDLCPETTLPQNVLPGIAGPSLSLDPVTGVTEPPRVGTPVLQFPARRGRKSSLHIVLSAAALGLLLALQRQTSAPAGLVRRTRIVLLLAEGHRSVSVAEKVGLSPRHVSKWGRRFFQQGVDGLHDKPRPGRKPKFSPSVALHLVKMACEMPDLRGRSLSQWDCQELARQLEAEGVVDSISSQSVWRILHNHRLKPWRHHRWLSPKVPRDAAFASVVRTERSL